MKVRETKVATMLKRYDSGKPTVPASISRALHNHFLAAAYRSATFFQLTIFQICDR